ncbi:hypothetical protein GCM10027061_27510 [Nesterenkonia suensis]
MLGVVDLSESCDVRSVALSGGQLRRLGLAELLVFSPSVMLLDEPTAGLDPEQRMRFRSVLDRVDRNHTVVVSTHHLEDLDGLAERVVGLQGGAVVFDGDLASFWALRSDAEDEPTSFGATRVAGQAYRAIYGDSV